MKSIYIILGIFCIVFVPFFLIACTIDTGIFKDDDVKARSSVSKKFSASKVKRLEASTSNGKIKSEVDNVDSIEVVFDKWATGHDEDDAKANLDDIKIYIDNDSSIGILKINVEYPHKIGTNYGCDIYITIPSDISLSLDSSNGEITVSGTKSDLDCNTSNGSLTIRDTNGDATLRTSNGAINIEDHAGNIDAKTSNGKIDADITIPDDGKCIMKTSNGSIDLSIPPDTSAEISANTSSGRIEIKDLEIVLYNAKKTEIEGKIGSGKGVIDLETSNGSITLKRMPY